MKHTDYIGETGHVRAENKLLKFFVIVIGIVVLINSAFLVTVMKHERTILVPAGLNSRVEVTDGTASEDYLKLMTRYVMSLALTYTPATARGQFGDLLNLYSPDSFSEAKKMFYNLADTVETAQVSNSFYIERIKDMGQGVIEVTGLERQFAQDGNSLSSDQATYNLNYSISDGRFILTGISEKAGSGSNSSEKRGSK